MKLEELINKHYRSLNDNDLLIWDYIKKNRRECEKLAIDQLAYKCNVSRTTILRFAQKLSLKGYSELKVYLRMENTIKVVEGNNIDTLCIVYMDLIRSLRNKNFDEVSKLIDEAENIYVYATGMIQSSVQKELKRIFMSAGKIFYDISGEREAKAIMKGMSDRDVVIIVSLSGSTEHALEFSRLLNIRNIPIVTITRLKENPLAQMGVQNLYISTAKIEQSLYHIEYEATTCYFILAEMLFLKYIEYQNRKKERDGHEA